MDLARGYKFKHPSPFDLRLSLSDEGARLDLSKALRMPLIYLCGGLDEEALAFSALKNFGQILRPLGDRFRDKRMVLSVDEGLEKALDELLA